MKELKINNRSYRIKDGFNVLSCEITDQKHNTIMIPELSIKHAVILLQNNNCQLMDLLSDDGVTVNSQTLEPLKWGALQDNALIKMGTVLARFLNYEDNDNEIICASPENSYLSRFNARRSMTTRIPDTEALDETAFSKSSSSAGELTKTFIPETQMVNDSSTENIVLDDSDPEDFPAESQSLFRLDHHQDSVDSLIASFSQPDSDDEELAQLNNDLKQPQKAPSIRESSATPELPIQSHDRSFLNVSTSVNDKERSVTPELDLPCTSSMNVSRKEMTPEMEFSLNIPSSTCMKPPRATTINDPEEDILTQKYVDEDIPTQKFVNPFEYDTQLLDFGNFKLPTRPTGKKPMNDNDQKTKLKPPREIINEEDLPTQKFIDHKPNEVDPFECATQALVLESFKLPTRVKNIKPENTSIAVSDDNDNNPFECATQALDIGSLKLPTIITRIKSEFEKKTKRAKPVVKPNISWADYDQPTQPYQDELTSTQNTHQRVFELDTEPCFLESPINNQPPRMINSIKRLQILRTPSPEPYNERSKTRYPGSREENFDDIYCLDPTIVVASQKKERSKKTMTSKNRILDSSDDESDDERAIRSKTPQTPKASRNITLAFSQEKNTPEFLSGMPSHSQLDFALDEANMSQPTEDENAYFNEQSDLEDLEEESLKVQQSELRKKKTDEIVIMKYENVDKKKNYMKEKSKKKTDEQKSSTSRKPTFTKTEPNVTAKSSKSSKMTVPDIETKKQSSNSETKKGTDTGTSKSRAPSKLVEQAPEVRKGRRNRVAKEEDIFVEPTKANTSAICLKLSNKESNKVIDNEYPIARSMEKKIESDVSLVSKRTRSKTVDPNEVKKSTKRRSVAEKDPDYVPKRTRREELNRLKVLLSNLGKNAVISNQYIVELGGIIVQDVKDADILMTCDAVNLTVKVLGAIMLGLPIVTFKWLSFSVAAGEFQDPNEYIIQDNNHERKHNYSLKNVIYRAQNHNLFQYFSIFVTSDSIPPPHELKFLIELGHGECLTYQMTPKHQRMFVVGQNQKEINEIKSRFKNILVISSTSFLMNVLLQQRIDLIIK